MVLAILASAIAYVPYASAQTLEPTPPTSVTVDGSAAEGSTGADCEALLAIPAHRQINGRHYLRAGAVVSCSTWSNSWTIIGLRGTARIAASAGGPFHVYSDSEQLRRSQQVPARFADVAWVPYQDRCNWGGDFNRYKIRVRVRLRVRFNSTGSVATSFLVYEKINRGDRIPCGDFEP
jgi:hypothetical protein